MCFFCSLVRWFFGCLAWVHLFFRLVCESTFKKNKYDVFFVFFWFGSIAYLVLRLKVVLHGECLRIISILQASLQLPHTHNSWDFNIHLNPLLLYLSPLSLSLFISLFVSFDARVCVRADLYSCCALSIQCHLQRHVIFSRSIFLVSAEECAACFYRSGLAFVVIYRSPFNIH